MLTLLLLRHAKAEQLAHGDDFDRKLTERGRADALALGVHLRRLHIVPDKALVSSAVRTSETFDLFAEGIGAPVDVAFDEALYNASEQTLRDLLKSMPPSVKTLLVVGHNPGIMDVAIRLARDGDGGELNLMRDRYPPCTLSLICFDTDDWRDARSTGGRLDLFLMPEHVPHG